MRDFDDVDLSLFGVAAWPSAYDGLAVRERPLGKPVMMPDRETATVVLDLKAESGADPLDDMQAMLSEMTKELRERFQRFQAQRRTSEQGAAASEDEAERKLAQADAKAAIEAVSLIVRTLEKIDSLQRTILSARRDADEGSAETADFEAVLAEFDRRVEEKARAYFERWKAEHGASAGRSAVNGTFRGSIDGAGDGTMGDGTGDGGGHEP